MLSKKQKQAYCLGPIVLHDTNPEFLNPSRRPHKRMFNKDRDVLPVEIDKTWALIV